MVRSALGEDADESFCSACANASGGNPFLLHELISELESERVEPVPASAARVEAVRPDSVAHAAVARLARLGGDATNLARSLAVLETGTLRQAATLAELDQERAAQAADRLVSAQILAPSAPLAFRPPAAPARRLREHPAGHARRQPPPGRPACSRRRAPAARSPPGT